LSSEITNGLRILGGGSAWEHIDPAALHGWASELLARIVAVMRDEETIQYVSGWVDDDPIVEGSVVLFTERRLIRATFSAPSERGQLTLDARVWVILRTSIRSVEVLSAGHLPTGKAENWPSKARVSLTIDEEGDALILPLRKQGTLGDEATARYLPCLL